MHQYWANFMHSGNPNKSNTKYPIGWTPVYENWKRFGDGKGWMNMGMNILIPDEERNRQARTTRLPRVSARLKIGYQKIALNSSFDYLNH